MADAPKKPRKPKAQKDPNAPVESKAAKFKRLATARLNTALQKISLIGNCSGAGYEYTQEQVDKLELALNQEVSNVIARFQPKSNSERPKVEL